ncbi:MAG: HIT family protein [Chloroflexota bacterium]
MAGSGEWTPETEEARYPVNPSCVFCRIAAGDEPARYVASRWVETTDRREAPSRGVLAFRNRLTWVRVMLLVTPVRHATQEEFWQDSELLLPALDHAITLGRERCCEESEEVEAEGFRLISNFGRVAHQTQEHGHIHVISRPANEPIPGPPAGPCVPDTLQHGVTVCQAESPSAPWSVCLRLDGARSQQDMFHDPRLPYLLEAAVDIAERESPEGYRFVADFLPEAGMGPPGFYVMGGGPLDLYA